MPSKSEKQRRFMAAAANNPKFARRAGIKQSVAREFHDADRRKARGGALRYALGGPVGAPPVRGVRGRGDIGGALLAARSASPSAPRGATAAPPAARARLLSRGATPVGAGLNNRPTRALARPYGALGLALAGRSPIRRAEGGSVIGRVFNPLDPEEFSTYGTTGGEHEFFTYGRTPGTGGASGAENLTGSAGAPPDTQMQDLLDRLTQLGIPVEQGYGSRLYDPPPLQGGQGIDWPGGGNGGALSSLTGAIRPNPGPGDIQSSEARVSDLTGSQYSIPNPLARYDPTDHIMPDMLGFNNPFSVIGRAYSQPLHLVDPYSMMNPRQQLGLGISGASGTDHFNLMQHLAFLSDIGYV